MPRANRNLSLFEDPAKVPEGFIYRPSFISQAEEQELIHEIQQLHLAPFQYYQFTGKRRTVSFGWQYEFGNKEITTAPDMPEFLLPIRTRAATFFSMDPNSLVQRPSSNIPPDRRSAGIVISRILASWWAFLWAERAG